METALGIDKAAVRTEPRTASDTRSRPGLDQEASQFAFRTLVDASRDAISVSVDDRHVYVNPAYVAMFGYESPDQLIGQPVDVVIAPEQRAQVIERSRRRRKGEPEPTEYDIQGLRRDGSTFPFEARVTTFVDRGAVHTFAVCRDVTEQRRQQLAFREAEERLRMATEAADVGTWYWDLRSGVLEWSRIQKRLHGLGDHEEITMPRFEALIHPEDRHKVYKGWLSALDTCQDLKIEYRVIRPDGEERWFEAMGRGIYRDDGTADRLVGVALDVTDRKESQEYVYRLNAILEKRVQERTEEMEAFTYSVSHDLRAPLRAIMSTSMILLEDFGERLGAEGTDHLRRQAAAAKRLGDLIDDLLGLSRIGRSAVHAVSFDMSALARDICEELSARDWGYAVSVSVQPDMTANGDPRLLRFGLQNLIENAMKFARPEAGVNVEVGREGSDGPFFVRDDGIGFSMDYVDKIFRPFERLHRDHEYPGTGVGLASAQRIIQRHGGQLWADAEPGRGSTFYFSL